MVISINVRLKLSYLKFVELNSACITQSFLHLNYLFSLTVNIQVFKLDNKIILEEQDRFKVKHSKQKRKTI